MLRFVLQVFGYLALSGCFVSAVIDGARSIAGGARSITTSGDLLRAWVSPIQQHVSTIHPFLWDPITFNILRLPLWFVLGLLGMALIWISAFRSRSAGYSSG